MADYFVGNHSFSIIETATPECPVSYITEQSMEYLRTHNRSQSLNLRPFGSLEKWPARWVDAFTLIDGESKRLEFLIREG